MPVNVGSFDRVIRLIAGIALMAYGYFATGNLRFVALAGVVLVATSVLKFCPAYWMLRIRTAVGGKGSA